MLNRRDFLLASSTLLATGPDYLQTQQQEKITRLGILTDVHYADADTRGSRHYRESITKIQEAAKLFRQEKPEAIFELGDLIDAPANTSREKELQFLKTIKAELDKSTIRTFAVLGNHCIGAMSKTDFLKGMGQQRPNMLVTFNDWSVLIIDACFRQDGTEYDSGNFTWTDTFIPDDQIDFIKSALTFAQDNVICVAHQRLDQPPESPHAVKNAAKVRQVLSESNKVKLVLQGHAHVNELIKHDNIPYATLNAVVEGTGPTNNAYSLLNLHLDGTIKLTGYRKHKSHPLNK